MSKYKEFSNVFKKQYENYIGGEWVAPKSGKYIDNISPINGVVINKVPLSNDEDIDFALDAAHAAKDTWAKTSPTERANILIKIAERIEENLELLAYAETWIMENL